MRWSLCPVFPPYVLIPILTLFISGTIINFLFSKRVIRVSIIIIFAAILIILFINHPYETHALYDLIVPFLLISLIVLIYSEIARKEEIQTYEKKIWSPSLNIINKKLFNEISIGVQFLAVVVASTSISLILSIYTGNSDLSLYGTSSLIGFFTAGIMGGIVLGSLFGLSNGIIKSQFISLKVPKLHGEYQKLFKNSIFIFVTYFLSSLIIITFMNMTQDKFDNTNSDVFNVYRNCLLPITVLLIFFSFIGLIQHFSLRLVYKIKYNTPFRIVKYLNLISNKTSILEKESSFWRFRHISFHNSSVLDIKK